ncbi:hypothetical protein HZH68_017145 [Vespula germanica]|uniref:Uncharacterized protein n=1 Tax=Vespula germanica TaxID=30212 RepID=A0A834IZS8_VESGE|nr:hypothetical protein HZH68_017145 [Vespula germanica]
MTITEDKSLPGRTLDGYIFSLSRTFEEIKWEEIVLKNQMHLDKHLDKYNKIFNRKPVYQFNQFDFFITGTRNCKRPEVIQLELKASKMPYAQMFLSPKTIDDVLSYVAENIPLTMTLMKIMIIRLNREALSKLFTEIKEYSLTEKYETKEEKMTFLNYTKLPPRFIAVTVCSMTLSDILYYTNGLSFGIQIAKENNSMGYQLPYKTLEMDIKDVRIYALICTCQIMYIPSILFGYVGFDCMFVNLSIQVIAQFAILSCKVKTELNYSKNYHEGMKKLVLRHYRLIR